MKDYDMDRARIISRRQYLKKREDKELELLEGAIEDEQYLFEGEAMTGAQSSSLWIGASATKGAARGFQLP